jgi:hypothetical protein
MSLSQMMELFQFQNQTKYLIINLLYSNME